MSTKTLGYIGAGSGIVSVVALALAVVALTSAIHQQTVQSTRDSQLAAQFAAALAARAASERALCEFYAFSIGEQGDPPPSTPLGAVRAKRAAERYAARNCQPPLPRSTP